MINFFGIVLGLGLYLHLMGIPHKGPYPLECHIVVQVWNILTGIGKFWRLHHL